MRTFAQKANQPETQSSLNFTRSAFVNHAAVHQIDPVSLLQRTAENQVGKLARKDESNSGSEVPATSAFAHDFSQIPVHAQGPTTMSEEATNPGAESFGQDDCPPGKAWIAGKHIAPVFVPNKKVAPERSNKLASETRAELAPNVTGDVAVDCKDKVWRYQLDPFVSEVDITITYYTEDHYPAPTPTDDTGELTNVTKENCKVMVNQLYRDRAKPPEYWSANVPKFWSAYKTDHLHENYHYNDEWKPMMNKFVPKFESEVEKLKVPFTNAKTATEAKKILEPVVQKGHGIGYSVVWRAWKAIPDVPGRGAYLAQVPAIEYMIKRVLKYAKEKKWLPAGYTPGKE